MICPSCRQGPTKVIDSRHGVNGTRRRRKCLRCGTRFSTREVVDAPSVATARPARTTIDYLREAAQDISHVLAAMRAELRASAGVDTATSPEE